jgi:hypothetical protein
MGAMYAPGLWGPSFQALVNSLVPELSQRLVKKADIVITSGLLKYEEIGRRIY